MKGQIIRKLLSKSHQACEVTCLLYAGVKDPVLTTVTPELTSVRDVQPGKILDVSCLFTGHVFGATLQDLIQCMPVAFTR